MDKYTATTYGEHIAGVYDQWYGAYEDAAIETLARMAQGGRALELGIGTGRIALPLAARGIEIHGIDASSDDGFQASRKTRRRFDIRHYGRLR